jgi:ankyrin repeat protein
MLRYLAKRGADLDLVNDRYRCTALQCAAEGGKRAIVDLLLALGASVNGPPGKDGFVIHYALNSRDESLVKHLFEKDAVVDDSRPPSTIETALRSKLAGLIPLLLEKGADINGTGEGISLPAWALYGFNNSKEAFKLLIDRGAALRDDDATVFIELIEDGQVDSVELMLEHGMNPNCHNEWQTPLTVSHWFHFVIVGDLR